MSHLTVRVQIKNGRISPGETETGKLPSKASGLLTILSDTTRDAPAECWPEDYFGKTAGALAGEPIERPPQLPLEIRDEW